METSPVAALPSTESPSQAGGIASWLTCGIAVLVVLGVFVGHAALRPVVIDLFDDFDTAVPWLTVTVLNIPSAISLTLGLVGAAALIVKEPIMRGRSAKILINVAAVLVSLLLAVVMGLAYLLPMVKVMQSVQ